MPPYCELHTTHYRRIDGVLQCEYCQQDIQIAARHAAALQTEQRLTVQDWVNILTGRHEEARDADQITAGLPASRSNRVSTRASDQSSYLASNAIGGICLETLNGKQTNNYSRHLIVLSVGRTYLSGCAACFAVCAVCTVHPESAIK